MWHRLFIAGSHGLVAIAFFNTAVFNPAFAADDQPADRAIVAVEASLQWWTQRKVEGYMKTLKRFMEAPAVAASS